ncbi:MAG: hypothetical protein P1U48_10625 [Pseudooceanicola sp.]|nr:hypothetical protein [Pseudooceanicola sp.]
MLIARAARYATPPYGMNLFYLCGILEQISDKEGMAPLLGVPIARIAVAVLP